MAKGVRNTNITRALECIEEMAKDIKRDYPEYSKTSIAIAIADSYQGPLYNAIILMLNEIDLGE